MDKILINSPCSSHVCALNQTEVVNFDRCFHLVLQDVNNRENIICNLLATSRLWARDFYYVVITHRALERCYRQEPIMGSCYKLLLPFWKSLVILAIWLTLSSAIYSRIALFFAQNRISFPANEKATLKSCAWLQTKLYSQTVKKTIVIVSVWKHNKA